jgi:hypothetical protein
MNNYSHESEDTRPITRVLYEKAAFGAVPVTYKLHNDDRLHPVQFIKHPELGSVQFSDGTTIVVSQPPAPVLKPEAMSVEETRAYYAEGRTEDGAGKGEWPSPHETEWPISPNTRLFSMDLPETATEDMAADLADAVTQTVTEETAEVPIVDDGMPVAYSDAETRAMARKFAPLNTIDDGDYKSAAEADSAREAQATTKGEWKR